MNGRGVYCAEQALNPVGENSFTVPCCWPIAGQREVRANAL